MSLLRDFLIQVETRPHAPCLREGEHDLNYGQTARRAGGIARALKGLHLDPGSPVALALPRGLDAACAVLGILAAGHPYLPLDMKAPPTRRHWIVQDARAVAVIGRKEEGATDRPWLDMDTIESADLPAVDLNPEILAAILYTSGSTGTPKGVALSQRAIHAFSDWARQLLNLSPSDRIAAIAPLHFDLSTFDLFSTLAAGACLDFLPDGLTAAPSRLTGWLADRRISGFYTVPSLLSFWVWKGNLAAAPPPALRFLLFAGEVFPTPRLRRMTELLAEVDCYNLYGPTETNVCCHWRVRRERLADDHPIPIGRPACGDELRLDHASGELQVRGPTLLSGYWREGRLHSALTADGWYATGDRAEQNRDGDYVWLGRLDRMLKVAGHRVEPAEIETVLSNLPGVAECAVVGIDDPDGTRPAAALVLAPDASLAAIRHALREKFPPYMLPGRFLTLPALPRLSNGKPDLMVIQQSFHRKT
ncbi:MAG: D-alanine--poly(phosphoribitol) ligase [Methylohalobius crimeensis]